MRIEGMSQVEGHREQAVRIETHPVWQTVAIHILQVALDYGCARGSVAEQVGGSPAFAAGYAERAAGFGSTLILMRPAAPSCVVTLRLGLDLCRVSAAVEGRGVC